MKPSTALSVLVVDPNVTSRSRTVTTLASAGFHVVATDAFESARQRIVTSPPAVLITAVKLGEYNGFHLVLRVKSIAPHTRVLVTSDEDAAIFQKEAHQAGATFMADPVTSQDMLAAVLRMLFRTNDAPIVPPFERRVSERRREDAAFTPDRRAADRRRGRDQLLSVMSVG
jgi:DNA-binding NtrC family response regulator